MSQGKGSKNLACRYPLRDFLILYHEFCVGARFFFEFHKNSNMIGSAPPANGEKGHFLRGFRKALEIGPFFVFSP